MIIKSIPMLRLIKMKIPRIRLILRMLLQPRRVSVHHLRNPLYAAFLIRIDHQTHGLQQQKRHHLLRNCPEFLHRNLPIQSVPEGKEDETFIEIRRHRIILANIVGTSQHVAVDLVGLPKKPGGLRLAVAFCQALFD